MMHTAFDGFISPKKVVIDTKEHCPMDGSIGGFSSSSDCLLVYVNNDSQIIIIKFS